MVSRRTSGSSAESVESRGHAVVSPTSSTSTERRVRYGISVPNFGEYCDVRAAAALAADAERAGWDGFFVGDHLVFDKRSAIPVADPWILLTAAALATTSIALGPMVTPIPRRRPWKLARETVTLDRLSGGRLMLGVGLGDPPDAEFGLFGEPTSSRTRAEMLDEGLEILVRLWSGERSSFSGRHYRLDDVAFAPTPVRGPRIPIVVGFSWPGRAGMRRASHYDGAFPIKLDDGHLVPLSASDVRDLLDFVGERRPGNTFEVMVGGQTDDPGSQRAQELIASLGEAGMTWWIEFITPMRGEISDIRDRIQSGTLLPHTHWE